ncbi:hypothetical protein BOO86_08385 [Mycobacterium sp. CBMA 234]|nr:hypothetical protein [Mycolicibacterium sp. CBMA 234]
MNACDPGDVARQLDESGVARVANAVRGDWLVDSRDEIDRWFAEHGERDHFITSPQDGHLEAIQAFMMGESVRAFLDAVVRQRFPDRAHELAGTAVRMVAGPHADGDAWWFHYDASVVTMVVPLFLPDAEPGESGELVGLFNKRPFRRSIAVNIVEKFVHQGGRFRRRVVRNLGRVGGPTVVDMNVGDVYLFWGYRSLHANMPIASGQRRVTLLIHYGQPHAPSGALNAAKRLSWALHGRAEATDQSAAGAY